MIFLIVQRIVKVLLDWGMWQSSVHQGDHVVLPGSPHFSRVEVATNPSSWQRSLATISLTELWRLQSQTAVKGISGRDSGIGKGYLPSQKESEMIKTTLQVHEMSYWKNTQWVAVAALDFLEN